MSPTFSDVITVISILLGVIGTLAGVVAYMFWKKLQDLENTIQEVKTLHNQMDTRVFNMANDLDNKLDTEIKQRMERHEDLAKRVFTDVGQVKEDLSDLSVTVSGFSGSYVTRTEYMQHCQENIGFLEKIAIKNQKS